MKKILRSTAFLLAGAAIVGGAFVAYRMFTDDSPTLDVTACPEPPLLSAPERAAVSEATPVDEQTRTLAAVARLWGIVRYFHPGLAANDTDWDAALVEALPAIRASSSQSDLESAVAGMLTRLEDPATRVVRGPLASAGENVKASWQVEPAPEGVAVLKVCYSGEPSDGSDVAVEDVIGGAKTLVIDLREGSNAARVQRDLFELALSKLLMESLSPALDEPVRASGERFVKYVGYPAQGSGSQMYTRRFESTSRGVLLAGNEGQRPRLVVLAGEHTPNVFDIVSSLQTEAGATVVFEGTPEGLAVASAHVYPVELAYDLIALVRTTDLDSGSGRAFAPDAFVSTDASPGAALEVGMRAARRGRRQEADTTEAPAVIRPLRENPYASMSSPEVEYRLLALFRFWNVIQHFYPYHDITNVPWQEALDTFIPAFENASGEEAYFRAVQELTTAVGDSHVTLGGSLAAKRLGTAWPGVVVRLIEDQAIIVRVLDDEARDSGLKVGDAIVEIDGRPVAAAVSDLEPVTAASTPQALRWRIGQTLLRGASDSKVEIVAQRADGARASVSLTRKPDQGPVIVRSTPIYQVLPEGLGYIDLGRVTPQQLPEAFKVVGDTPGLILDMRGYPNSIFGTLPTYLGQRTGAAVSIDRPEPDGRFPERRQDNHFSQALGRPGPDVYKGEVVAIMNEEAISQAEHTLLHLAASRPVTFIGTATVGANGDITSTVLPGGVTVSFTGLGIRYADGRQLQRVGVQPDIRIEATVAGLRAGRDELLEAAIAFLLGR